jgi:hypothetical protein
MRGNRVKLFGLASACAIIVALGGCNSEPQQEPAEKVADQLDQAASQSDPKAAEVISERADQLRGMESAAAPGEPGSYAQETMRQAGAAAAETGTAEGQR